MNATEGYNSNSEKEKELLDRLYEILNNGKFSPFSINASGIEADVSYISNILESTTNFPTYTEICLSSFPFFFHPKDQDEQSEFKSWVKVLHKPSLTKLAGILLQCDLIKLSILINREEDKEKRKKLKMLLSFPIYFVLNDKRIWDKNCELSKFFNKLIKDIGSISNSLLSEKNNEDVDRILVTISQLPGGIIILEKVASKLIYERENIIVDYLSSKRSDEHRMLNINRILKLIDGYLYDKERGIIKIIDNQLYKIKSDIEKLNLAESDFFFNHRLNRVFTVEVLRQLGIEVDKISGNDLLSLLYQLESYFRNESTLRMLFDGNQFKIVFVIYDHTSGNYTFTRLKVEVYK